MLATKQSPIDPNNVPLASLIAQEKDQVDVNFLNRSNFNNNAYRNNFGSNNYKPYPPNMSLLLLMITMFPLILLLWILSVILLVLLFLGDRFLEQLVLLLI